MYLRVPAPTPIAHCVDEVWVQHDDRDARREAFAPTRVLPSAQGDMIFHYAEPFAERGPAGERALLPLAYVCGQRTRPVEVEATGRTGLVIVRFQPWGLASLVRGPVDDLTDRSLDARCLLPPAAVATLLDRLREAGGARVRAELMLELLGQRLAGSPRDLPVQRAARRIAQHGGQLPVAALARELGLSRFELTRRFKDRIGVSPKRFAEVVRFQRGVGLRRAGLGWSEVARTCGYYDQSHLIRAFSRFSGQSFGRFPASPTGRLGRFFSRPEPACFGNAAYV